MSEALAMKNEVGRLVRLVGGLVASDRSRQWQSFRRDFQRLKADAASKGALGKPFIDATQEAIVIEICSRFDRAIEIAARVCRSTQKPIFPFELYQVFEEALKVVMVSGDLSGVYQDSLSMSGVPVNVQPVNDAIQGELADARNRSQSLARELFGEIRVVLS